MMKMSGIIIDKSVSGYFVVRGKTYDHRSKLRELGGEYNREKAGWVFPEISRKSVVSFSKSHPTISPEVSYRGSNDNQNMERIDTRLSRMESQIRKLTVIIEDIQTSLNGKKSTSVKRFTELKVKVPTSSSVDDRPQRLFAPTLAEASSSNVATDRPKRLLAATLEEASSSIVVTDRPKRLLAATLAEAAPSSSIVVTDRPKRLLAPR